MTLPLQTTIDLSREHNLRFSEARAKAEAVAKVMAEQYGVDWQWDRNAIRFAGKGRSIGVRGVLSLAEHRVRIVIHLPLLLTAFEGRIKAECMQHLDGFARLPPR